MFCTWNIRLQRTTLHIQKQIIWLAYSRLCASIMCCEINLQISTHYLQEFKSQICHMSKILQMMMTNRNSIAIQWPCVINCLNHLNCSTTLSYFLDIPKWDWWWWMKHLKTDFIFVNIAFKSEIKSICSPFKKKPKWLKLSMGILHFMEKL